MTDGKTYFIDEKNGSDTNDGLARDRAFRTNERLDAELYSKNETSALVTYVIGMDIPKSLKHLTGGQI